MKVPEETIEQIRNTLDVVDVIGEYVQLKKQGRSFVGLCPFHNEHTPSFSVSPEKQIFHCFGCSIGGNIYTFIMEIEGLSFPEAIKHLGDKAKIDLPELDQVANQPKKNDDRALLFNAHELLMKFYHYCLVDSRYGETGKDYLAKRGFSQETIKTFQLGYAVNSWDTTTRFLEKRKLSLDQLVNAGIIAKRDFDGKYFDRFRNRVMFPIWDRHGKPIAFGGRILNDEKPKYLNSPESNIFHKGKILYGYHLARSTIKQKNQVILFEGYVDVIKAHQAGITNTVASMGTSLTDEQAGLLTRNAETIIICYDSDDAGITASFRAAEMIQGDGKMVKIANMPRGLDPDDYIDRFGGERFVSDVIGASQTVMAFKVQYLRKGRNLQDEGDRMRYLEEVLREVAQLDKAVERDHYLRQLSEEFSISLDALKQQQFQQYKRQRQKSDAKRQKQDIPLRGKLIGLRNDRLLPAHRMAEKLLVAHMMRSIDVADRVQDTIGGAFKDDLHQALSAHIFAYYSEGNQPDMGRLIQKLGDRDLQNAATELAMMQLSEPITEQELEDYINQVVKYSKLLEIEKKEAEKKGALQDQNSELAANITAEIIRMKQELKEQ